MVRPEEYPNVNAQLMTALFFCEQRNSKDIVDGFSKALFNRSSQIPRILN